MQISELTQLEPDLPGARGLQCGLQGTVSPCMFFMAGSESWSTGSGNVPGHAGWSLLGKSGPAQGDMWAALRHQAQGQPARGLEGNG